jgi:phosphoglycerate dehydrogenase-like enzyme
MTAALNVLIASPLEAEHADQIASADPRVNLLYEPDLLPLPRYPSDHTGIARDLDEAALAKWSRLRAAADISFDFDWQAPGQIPANCPRLRWIQGTSAGIGGLLDRTGLIKSPIIFTTAAGVHGVPLAEFTLLGLLHFAKRMPKLASDQAERRWELQTTTLLRGSRVLLVGLGGVGREVAALLAGVGVYVVGAGLPGKSYAVEGVTEYVADTQIADVLGSVDALILACPLTPRTRHLIGGRELGLMRQDAVLVNVARGAVVDESAMIDALAAGRISGACLDVFEAEPLPADSPLWRMENVIISPHSASTVADENRLLTDLFTDNIARWLADEPLRNLFDKDAGY